MIKILNIKREFDNIDKIYKSFYRKINKNSCSNHCKRVAIFLYNCGYNKDVILLGMLSGVAEVDEETKKILRDNYGKGIVQLSELVLSLDNLSGNIYKSDLYYILSNANEGLTAYFLANNYIHLLERGDLLDVNRANNKRCISKDLDYHKRAVFIGRCLYPKILFLEEYDRAIEIVYDKKGST